VSVCDHTSHGFSWVAEWGFALLGQECWCGDVADVTGNGGVLGAEADCAMPCSGDGVHICGGPERLTLYYWTGGTPLYTWNTPANKGSYQFLTGGIVLPLVATVGINNKVRGLLTSCERKLRGGG
jgi:hypothetical protein